MGFQHMTKVERQATSRKGGKLRVSKGIGKLPPSRRKEIASMGGKAKPVIKQAEIDHSKLADFVLKNDEIGL